MSTSPNTASSPAPKADFVATRTTVALGFATLPQGMGNRLLYGISVLAGIGFTMSLFIGSLAFAGADSQNALTLGVLMGTALSACWGFVFLRKLRP